MALNCYTYNIEVMVSVLATSEEEAEQNMQRTGHVISESKVLVNTTPVHE